ncbi:MAG: hypothetical protein WC376_01345 [Candidatus Nanoarchaeia archaeon]
MESCLIDSELELLNEFNKKYANSYFKTIELGPMNISDKVNMNYVATYDFNEKITCLSIIYSKKCVDLLKEGNIYFTEFRKPMLAHEVIEAHQSFFIQDPHNYANNYLISTSPNLNLDKINFRTGWKWEDIESLIKNIESRTHKTVEEISWYLFPRLSTIGPYGI